MSEARKSNSDNGKDKDRRSHSVPYCIDRKDFGTAESFKVACLEVFGYIDSHLAQGCSVKIVLKKFFKEKTFYTSSEADKKELEEFINQLPSN